MSSERLAAELCEASRALARAAGACDLEAVATLLEQRGRLLADARTAGLVLGAAALEEIRADDAATRERLRDLSSRVGEELARLREARDRLRRPGEEPRPRFLSERA